MAYNVPLFRKAMEAIEADLRSWDQNWYLITQPGCGTTMCLAGHALVQSGQYEVDHDTMFHAETSAPITIAEAAMRELGIDPREARVLFGNMTRDPAALRTAIEFVIGERL